MPGFLFQSCVKEHYTLYKAFLINNSSHNITVFFYKQGWVHEGDTLRLNLGDSVIIADGSMRGEINTPGFNSKHFGNPNDSIVAVFDDSFRVVHYADPPRDSLLADKYYLFSSLRNIGNPKSYEFERIKQSKHVYNNIHRYYFTEADYEFAKQ